MSTTKRAGLPMYVFGYIMSLGLTLAAYFLVTRHAFSTHILIGGIVVLALTQFIVQLLCFLHLGTETKPRWKLWVFLFMIMVVSILVFGSLWIMNNLNYNMLSSPTQINNYLQSQDGI